MPTKSNPDLLLAQTLAAPFTPRSQGTPLSLRHLPDGGMVVISADGRKLWFSAAEVAAARAGLEDQARHPAQAAAPQRTASPVKLVKPKESPAQPYNGFPLRVSIPEDMKKKT